MLTECNVVKVNNINRTGSIGVYGVKYFLSIKPVRYNANDTISTISNVDPYNRRHNYVLAGMSGNDTLGLVMKHNLVWNTLESDYNSLLKSRDIEEVGKISINLKSENIPLLILDSLNSDSDYRIINTI